MATPAANPSARILTGLLVAMLGLGGCGGGGGNAGASAVTVTPATSHAPVVSTPAAQSITGSSTTVGITATDPDGDVLTFSWSGSVDDPALALFSSTTAADPTIEFPLAGTYRISVTVSDPGGHAVTRTVDITVGELDSFTISGVVRSNGSPTVGAQADLVWKPLNVTILSATSGADGVFSFAGLKGLPDDFQVRVAEHP